MAELTSDERNYGCKAENIYYLSLYRKCLLTPVIIERKPETPNSYTNISKMLM